MNNKRQRNVLEQHSKPLPLSDIILKFSFCRSFHRVNHLWIAPSNMSFGIWKQKTVATELHTAAEA